jgi:methylglyoxal reductase
MKRRITMRMIKLGKTGKEISKMGLGTWSIGGGSAWGGDHDLKTVVDTICEAPKVGINLIDTAPGYNFGNSEKIVGMALKQMKREDVTIITKCGVTWDQEMKGSLFNVVNGIQLYKNLNSASIRREIEDSLERLGTDYVDVYMTHWQSVHDEYYVPIEKTMEVLNDLKAQGKIHAIGAANVDIHHIEEYLKWGDLDIVQAKYSVLDRAIEEDIIPCCKENGITLQAYSPLEMGLLSGTMPRDYKPVGAQIPKKWFQPENMQKAMDMMDAWKPLTEKYNCSIANLALAWILGQGEFITLLSGSTTVDQIRENAKSAELELEAEDVAMMREMAEALDK